MNIISRLLATVTLFGLTGCTGMPEQVTPIKPFSIDSYLGTWYEIARLDHSFERGLTKVSATYSLNKDGSVKVINRGFNKEASQWKEAEGKAKFVGLSDTAHLKVSFFSDRSTAVTSFFILSPTTPPLWLAAITQIISGFFPATSHCHKTRCNTICRLPNKKASIPAKSYFRVRYKKKPLNREA